MSGQPAIRDKRRGAAIIRRRSGRLPASLDPAFPPRLRAALVAGFGPVATGRRAGAALGITPGAVSQWCCGLAYPTVPHLRAISELCGVSLDWLVKGEDGEGAAWGEATVAVAPEVERRTA